SPCELFQPPGSAGQETGESPPRATGLLEPRTDGICCSCLTRLAITNDGRLCEECLREWIVHDSPIGHDSLEEDEEELREEDEEELRRLQLSTPPCWVSWTLDQPSYPSEIVWRSGDNLDKAIEDLSRAIRVAPDNVDLYEYRGCMRLLKGRLEKGYYDEGI